MPISFQCTNCQSVYNVQDQMAGKRVRCKCGAELIIPPPIDTAPIVARPAPTPSNAPPAAPLSSIDDLLSEEFPAAAGIHGTGVDPLAAGPTLESVRPRRRAKWKVKPGVLYGIGGGAAGLVALVVLIWMLSSGGISVPGFSREPGFATPEKACAAWLKASKSQNAGLLWNCLAPSARDPAVAVVLTQVVQFAPMDKGLEKILRDHGLEPRQANLPPDEIQALVNKIQDKRGFFIRASGAVNKFSRSFLESMMPDEVKRAARKNEANVEFDQEDWDIQGDSATVMLVARNALSESRMRLAFVRIDERWYIQ